MNKEKFEKELTKLIGKKVENVWDMESDIRKAFVDAIGGDKDLNITCEHADGNTYVVRYKRHYVCDVNLTRTRGEWHSSYFGSHYDYYYKSFVINKNDPNPDFNYHDKVAEIEKMIDANNACEARKHAEALALIKEIREMYPNDSISDTFAKLNYIYKHSWTLQKEIMNYEKH